ncbi:MAG: ABC transporter ATP-binding protein [Planctomycetia bacterium]|nr:ABC transporter ATP-binding protein [Planctomycetia bacterium]
MSSLSILACGVHKSFGTGAQRTHILKSAGLGIAAGEIVFLAGPSGSGKTTLLSILGCLLTPDEGGLHVLGHDVGALNHAQRTAFRCQYLGFIFQTFNLFPTLSALDNIALSLVMRGLSAPQANARSLALLEQLGLQQRVHLRPAQLSTGECQRVAVARALANEPAILLADEPTASLDGENGQLVLQLLTDLVRQRGMTLVVVTHDHRIFPFADRIVHLENGRLIRASKPGDLANLSTPKEQRHERNGATVCG